MIKSCYKCFIFDSNRGENCANLSCKMYALLCRSLVTHFNNLLHNPNAKSFQKSGQQVWFLKFRCQLFLQRRVLCPSISTSLKLQRPISKLWGPSVDNLSKLLVMIVYKVSSWGEGTGLHACNCIFPVHQRGHSVDGFLHNNWWMNSKNSQQFKLQFISNIYCMYSWSECPFPLPFTFFPPSTPTALFNLWNTHTFTQKHTNTHTQRAAEHFKLGSWA